MEGSSLYHNGEIVFIFQEKGRAYVPMLCKELPPKPSDSGLIPELFSTETSRSG